MLQRIRNARGVIETSVILVGTLIAGIAGTGLYKTYKNGVLRNNGKIIWCKMMNNGNNACDAKYLPFTPTE